MDCDLSCCTKNFFWGVCFSLLSIGTVVAQSDRCRHHHQELPSDVHHDLNAGCGHCEEGFDLWYNYRRHRLTYRPLVRHDGCFDGVCGGSRNVDSDPDLQDSSPPPPLPKAENPPVIEQGLPGTEPDTTADGHETQQPPDEQSNEEPANPEQPNEQQSNTQQTNGEPTNEQQTTGEQTDEKQSSEDIPEKNTGAVPPVEPSSVPSEPKPPPTPSELTDIDVPRNDEPEKPSIPDPPVNSIPGKKELKVPPTPKTDKPTSPQKHLPPILPEEDISSRKRLLVKSRFGNKNRKMTTERLVSHLQFVSGGVGAHSRPQ